MEINFFLGLIIFTLSIFQSIFGIGLLALGTPLLLIIGFYFIDILYILLPCSILVSLITFIIISKNETNIIDRKVINNFVYFSVPGIIVGLTFIYYNELNLNFKILIARLIIISALLKKYLKRKTNQIINNKKMINFVIGTIHGISNMGGSFLSIYLLSIYKSKIKVRYHLTFAYIFFAITQLVFLQIMYDETLNNYNIFLLILFATIGSLLGNFLDRFINKEFFFKILNICILLTALILLIKSINILL